MHLVQQEFWSKDFKYFISGWKARPREDLGQRNITFVKEFTLLLKGIEHQAKLHMVLPHKSSKQKRGANINRRKLETRVNFSKGKKMKVYKTSSMISTVQTTVLEVKLPTDF